MNDKTKTCCHARVSATTTKYLGPPVTEVRVDCALMAANEEARFEINRHARRSLPMIACPFVDAYARCPAYTEG